MPRVGFEPTISAGERSKTYALDRAATGTGQKISYGFKNNISNLAPLLTTEKNIFRFLLHVCLVPSLAVLVK